MMVYPEDYREFMDEYSYINDKISVMPVFRVYQMVDHYFSRKKRDKLEKEFSLNNYEVTFRNADDGSGVLCRVKLR